MVVFCVYMVTGCLHSYSCAISVLVHLEFVFDNCKLWLWQDMWSHESSLSLCTHLQILLRSHKRSCRRTNGWACYTQSWLSCFWGRSLGELQIDCVERRLFEAYHACMQYIARVVSFLWKNPWLLNLNPHWFEPPFMVVFNALVSATIPWCPFHSIRLNTIPGHRRVFAKALYRILQAE